MICKTCLEEIVIGRACACGGHRRTLSGFHSPEEVVIPPTIPIPEDIKAALAPIVTPTEWQNYEHAQIVQKCHQFATLLAEAIRCLDSKGGRKQVKFIEEEAKSLLSEWEKIKCDPSYFPIVPSSGSVDSIQQKLNETKKAINEIRRVLEEVLPQRLKEIDDK